MKNKAPPVSWTHYAAKVNDFSEPLLNNREACLKLWAALRADFPVVAAAALMPTHVHVIAPEGRAGVLGRLLNTFTATRDSDWLEGARPTPISDRHHLLRQVKYVHMNPCRDGLAKCPLEWEFSTHRDYLGLVQDPWPAVQKSIQLLEIRSVEDFHRHLSSDFSTHAEGTDFVKKAGRGASVIGQTGEVPRAIAQILRVSDQDPEVRRVGVALLYGQEGWSAAQVGEGLGMSESAVRQVSYRGARVRRVELSLLKTYLKDHRLK